MQRKIGGTEFDDISKKEPNTDEILDSFYDISMPNTDEILECNAGITRDVIFLVSMLLRPETIVKLMLVSKSFHKVISVVNATSNQLWKFKFQENFPQAHNQLVERPSKKLTAGSENFSWYENFKSQYSSQYDSGAFFNKIAPPIKALFSLFSLNSHDDQDLALLKETLKRVSLKDLCRFDKDSRNIFSLANQNNHQEALKILYEFAIIQKPYLNRTKLHWFIICNQPVENLASLISDEKIDINAGSEEGGTALYFAAAQGQVEAVNELIKLGANINECRYKNITPLYLAAQNGHDKVVDVLLQHQADATIAPRINRELPIVPLHIAVENGHLEVVKSFINNLGAAQVVDFRYMNQSTPLILAIEAGNYEMAKLLLENGANPNLSLHYNLPVDLAKQNGFHKIAQLIESYRDKESIKKYMQDLDVYVKNANTRQDDDGQFKFTVFGETIYSIGISAKAKKLASNALYDVVFNDADSAILADHQEALTEGTLGTIYKGLKSIIPAPKSTVSHEPVAPTKGSSQS